MKTKLIYSFFILFILISFSSTSLAFFIPTWSELDTTEVNADTTADNFLNIESQSAILIEQTTRRNTF